MYKKNQVKLVFQQQSNEQYGITTSMEGLRDTGIPRFTPRLRSKTKAAESEIA
jgi:hypothetical protein